MRNTTSPDLIVYSGSFDPLHQGHLDCVNLTTKAFTQAKILVIPGLKPAGSSGNHKNPSAKFEDRFSLCEKEFAKLENANRISVSDIEAHMPTPNYTVNTLSKIASLNPGKKLGLLIGEDQLIDFPLWHQPEEILKISSLIVIKRQQAGKKPLDLEDVSKRVAKTLGFDSSSILLVSGNTSDAESRLVRGHLAKNERLPSHWLPDSALKYIKEKRLYEK